MNIFSEPKIDSHCHVFEPSRFPYGENVHYRPEGQEMGNAKYFQEVMSCYGVKHALLVGPNSGYNTDNSCLLDAISNAPNTFKGIAVVPNEISLEELQNLKAQGIIGIAFHPALMGVDFYSNIEPLLNKLQQLDMWAQFQVENMDGRLTGTRDGYSNPDFQDLARSYGFRNVSKITCIADLVKLKNLTENMHDEPFFLEFVIDPLAKALPKMSLMEE
jgi:hypothetical protein